MPGEPMLTSHALPELAAEWDKAVLWLTKHCECCIANALSTPFWFQDAASFAQVQAQLPRVGVQFAAVAFV
jgi:hypothetical protein